MEQPKLSDEELAALLAAAEDSHKNKGNEPPTRELNEAERFVIACSIKEGKEKIQPFHVYHRYCQWCESIGSKPLLLEGFARQFKKLFTVKRGSHSNQPNKYYLLDRSSFPNFEDNYFKMLADLREFRKQRNMYGRKCFNGQKKKKEI